MKSALCIVETAYRATQEEQDDAAMWFTHALRKAGSPVGVVLRGHAVSYVVRGQDATGIEIGSMRIERPPRPDEDLAAMVKEGIPVYVVREDLAARGIPAGKLAGPFEIIAADKLPDLFSRYDQIWHW